MDIFNHKTTIIIGLPGSGKSYLLNQLRQQNKIKVYDDCLFEWYKGQALRSLKHNHKVFISDPRLCYINTFEKIYQDITEIIDPRDICLVLFKNQPDRCKSNLSTNKTIKNSRRSTDTYNLSKLYDIDNYKKYNVGRIIVKDVYY